MKIQHPTGKRRAFTLLELVVVLEVIAVLLGLLLPAVQRSRETARTLQCHNHLRQLGAAVLNHESIHGHFPSNGWGFQWVGEPDRGTGKEQPGGWIYNLLDFVEQSELRTIGKGTDGMEHRRDLRELTRQRIPLFKCPSRTSEQSGPQIDVVFPRNALWSDVVARSDYAANEGDFVSDTDGGPASLSDGDSASYRWTDTSAVTGVFFLRSEIRVRDITDGLSQTLMLGEKHVSLKHYHDGNDPGYDQSMFVGVDWDINRWTIQPPLIDGEAVEPQRFGSSHFNDCAFVLCDGSVRRVAYSIDVRVYRSMGTRSTNDHN